MEKILEIKNLIVSFKIREKKVKILRGVDLSIEKNEVVSLAGESGSGKTLTGLSVIKLLPKNAFFENGEIYIDGENILEFSEIEMEKIRGEKIGMIFQEPSSYLNPVYTVGNQVEEAIKGKINKKEKKEKVIQIFKEVGLKENVYFKYPHQLSGGMQQRVLISIALINNPYLLIADEVTTALDVTTAIQIIELLKNLINKFKLSVLFITHDISLAKIFSHKIAVMYSGEIVEIGPIQKIFENPLHPYTENLISCLPEKYKKGDKLKTIPGNIPDFENLPSGCSFHPRCYYKKEICLTNQPGKTQIEERFVRCFKYGNIVENRKS